MLYTALLAAITWSDLLDRRIPDETVLLGMLLRFLSGAELSATWLLVSLFFMLLSLCGLGWGDVKLAMLLYLDPTLLAARVLLAFGLAAAAGLLLLLLGKAKKESHLPMAPFLILSDLLIYSIFPALPSTWRIL